MPVVAGGHANVIRKQKEIQNTGNVRQKKKSLEHKWLTRGEGTNENRSVSRVRSHRNTLR